MEGRARPTSLSLPLPRPLSLLSLSLSLSLLLPSALAYIKVATPDQNWDTAPYRGAKLGRNRWYKGSATWYDFSGGSPGACGYPWSVVNSIDFAATPDPRWQTSLTRHVANWGGMACGQCYEVKCLAVPRYGRRVYCNRGNPSVIVQITDYDVPGTRPGGKSWPNNHFDLKPSAFAKIADKAAGEINLMWKRVPCDMRRTCKWMLWHDSNDFWHNMVIYNIPGVGAMTNLYVRPAGHKKWMKPKRSWGVHWDVLGFMKLDRSTEVYARLAEGKKQVKCEYSPTT